MADLAQRRRLDLDRATYAIAVWGLGGLALAIMVGPVLIALLVSFTNGLSLKFPPDGLSLRWYAALLDPLQSSQIHEAAGNSITVALWTMAIATLLGVAAALAVARSDRAWMRGLELGFMSPLVLPLLAYGLAVLMFFSLLGFRASKELLIIGHVAVCSPFVFKTTLASLSQLNPALLDSSASLGAGAVYTFRRVTLPVILPGVMAGAFLSFMASLDNVPVSLFVADARTEMLPIRMWHMLEGTLDVRVAAVSGVLIAFTLAAMVGMERLTGLSRRLR